MTIYDMNVLSPFLLLILLNVCVDASKHSNQKKTSNGSHDKCVETLKFINCKNGTKRVHRNQNMKIAASFKRCPKKEYKFDFNLVNVDTGEANEFLDNPSGSTLFLNKYSLMKGTYKVVLNVYTTKTDISIFRDDCLLTVDVSPPIPVIEGGFQRYIGEGIDLLLNASRSVDFNSIDHTDTNNFEFTWIYDCDGCGGFITAPEKGPIFVIIGTHHRKEMGYLIRLGVRTKWWDELVFTQQMAYVRKKTPGIDVTCLANCNPAFREGPLVLLPICTYDCPKRFNWKWSIYKVPKDDLAIIDGMAEWDFQFTDDSIDSNTFELDEDEFDHNTGYLATVTLNEFNETAASYKFITGPKYNFNCAIKPRKGVVLETKFSFGCNGKSFGTHYWVTVSTVNREQILQYDSSWEYLSFMVPHLGAVNLRFSDYSGQEAVISWDPAGADFTLEEFKKNPKEIDDLYNKGNESVKSYLAQHEYLVALDKMTLVSKSIASINASDFYKVESVAETLVRDLKHIPMKDLAHVEKATSIMADLTSIDLVFSTELISKISLTCNNLASKYRKLVKHDYLGGKTGDLPVHTTVSQLMQCTSAGNRPNMSAIVEKDVDIEVTTAVYIVEEGNINTEFYDQYKDEESSMHNIEKYKNVAKTFMDVCNLGGRVLLRRLMSSNKKSSDIVHTDNYTIMVTRKYGYKIVTAPMKVLGIKLSFSKDLVDSEELYSIIMCGTSDDISWWQEAIDIVSDILVISIRFGKHLVTHFQKPFEIVFKLRKMPRIRHKPLVSSVRMKHLTRDPEEAEEEQLSIYVIALEADHSLAIQFKNLDKGMVLNVISTTFKLPVLSDFKEDLQIIHDDLDFYFNQGVYHYDTFRLVAVMVSPLEEKKRNHSFTFEMTAYAVTCMKWRDEEMVWTPGCKARFGDNDAIVCYCEDLSTITSSIKNIPVKQWEDHLTMPVDLEEQLFLGASIFVGVIFLIYSVAICFAVKEEDFILKNVYFLSDVVRDDRFGYLIIIRNLARLGSGTTSNVMIKLTGTKGESDPHVLNYPDPLMLILQRRAENWFLLATKDNLGRITEIELWIDGVGSSPSWGCNTVTILDLQHREWYRFGITQTFMAYPKPKVYLRSKPIDDSKELSSTRIILDLIKKCLPGFELFNLSLRRREENWSFVKRLSVMLSIFTSIASWCIVINGVPVRNPSDSIMKSCTYRISSKMVMNGIGGSITTAFYQIPINYLFLTSHVQIPLHPFLQRSMKPTSLTVLCWILTMIIITSNLTFIVIFGVWMPDVTSLTWITEMVIGMIFYIFAIDVIYGTFMKMVNPKVQFSQYIQRAYNHIMEDIEKQRLILYRVFGKNLLRPFLQHLYTPLHGLSLRVLWHREKIKYEVKELLQNLITFLIYISLMYMVILANRDYHSVYSHQHVENLMEGYVTRTFPFEKVISVKDLEYYIEKTLIEATQSKIWYGNYAVREPGLTVDYKNKILGVVRLRQHRSKPHSCEVPDSMVFMNISCNADFFNSQTKDDYGEYWDRKKRPPLEGRMKNIWRYTPSNKTGSSTYIGKLGIYPGGGYVAFLGRSMKNSLVNFGVLKSHRWLDPMTRSIFIEFLLYNANSNIFNAVQYTIEKSNLGYLKKELKVTTTKMLLLENESFIAIPVLLGLFIFLVVAFSIRTIIRIYRTRIWYFRDVWHLVDIMLIILSLVCVSLFYRRSAEVGVLLKSLEGIDPKDFVNYFPLLEVDKTFTVISAILISVATVKLWGIFRFIAIFRIVERTFQTSFFPLCALFFYNAIVILAFAFFGFSLFVDHSYRFEGYFNTVEFLILLNLRPFEGEEIEMLVEPKLGFGYVFYVSYAIAVQLFNCIFTALIMIHYSKAQEYYSNYSKVYSIWEYIKTQFFFRYNFLKMRFKAFRMSGGDASEKYSVPVSPKADETRYAESTTLSIDKIRAMSLLSLCVIRNSDPNRKPLTQKNIRIMTYALYYLKKIEHKCVDEEDVERFYKGHLGGNKVKLIHERILKKIEHATSVILGKSQYELKSNEILMEENLVQVMRMKENLSVMLETVKKINVKVGAMLERLDSL